MAATIQTLPVEQIIYREDLYPRFAPNPHIVQQYAADLSVLPPIEVNQHHILIDGWHRWTAHRKMEAKTIQAMITETASEAQLFLLALERNSTHGLQLSEEEKRHHARQIYHATPERERADKKHELQRILSVSDRTIRDWFSRIDKDMKEERDRRIFSLWLACHTQQEIAQREGVSQPSIAALLSETANMPILIQPAAEHVIDYAAALYNTWKQQERSPGVSHFGNTEITFVDHLLYLYTKPLEVVVDPFAGSGSTIDICKKRWRRYYVSDRKPIIERAHEIREWDITKGLPKCHLWKEVALVYLDPPYWKQAEGQYSDDPEDLSNMSLEDFTATLVKLIKQYASKLRSDAHIAMVMTPTQWNAPTHQYTDHLLDIAREIQLPVAQRISCPYESQQATPQMVEWAKANKTLLTLTREIIVWRIP